MREIKAGATSQLLDVFIADSSSTVGAGLTGVLFNSATLSAYYIREGAASATSITLATMTIGTWATGGFIEIDATNMPGWYQIGIPNAALAASAEYVSITLKGAANMVNTPVQIELPVNTSEDNQDELTHASYGLDQLVRSTTPANTLDVNATGEAGLDYDNTSGTIADTDIATDAITAAKIAADAIGSSELATDAIGASQIATDAIGSDELAASAITEIQSGLATTSTLNAHLATLQGALGATISLTKLAQKDTAGAYDPDTDSQEAIRDRGDSAWITGGGAASPLLLQNTTLATVASQGQFTLTAGSADDDTYNGRICIITDQVTSEQKGVVLCKDYVGSTKTLIVHDVPQFTVAVGDTIDVLAPGDSTLYALDRSTVNIIDVIESQRGAHTMQGNIFYWDPENGNDNNDALTHSTAKKTFASAYALVVSNHHDVVVALAGAAAGKTVTTETPVLDKEYSFLRGPGRDFRFKPTVTNADTITLSAEGAEFSGAIVETAESGSRDAISVSADFVRVRAWVDQSRGDAVHLEDANNCLIDIWIQDAGEGGSGQGIHLRSTSNPTTKNTICGNIIDTTGDGLRFDGAQCTNNFLTVNGNGTQVIGSSGFGVNEVNSADFNFIVGPGIFFANNTSGDVNLTGANSAAINVEQWAKQSGTVVGTMSANALAQFNDFDPATDTVANVTLVDTTTTNTDMRGTDSAALASVATEARLAELDAANLPAEIDTIEAKTTNLPVGVKKNVQRVISFKMVDSATGLVAQTGLTVTLTISKDGGAHASSTNSVTEVSGGWYKVTLTATELNADEIVGIPTATASQGGFVIVTDA